jgi:dihydroneopterin aldolase
MPPHSDHVRLSGLIFWGRHGHLPFERELGNRFEVDVDLVLDISRAAEVDRIDLTVDLAQVWEAVRSEMEGEPCHLLETLADRIARHLARMDKVGSATVRVRKMFPPLAGATQGIMEVEVTRVP